MTKQFLDRFAAKQNQAEYAEDRAERHRGAVDTAHHETEYIFAAFYEELSGIEIANLKRPAQDDKDTCKDYEKPTESGWWTATLVSELAVDDHYSHNQKNKLNALNMINKPALDLITERKMSKIFEHL